jgi:hypothetical protein
MCRNGQPSRSLRRIASQWLKPPLILIVAGNLFIENPHQILVAETQVGSASTGFYRPIQIRPAIAWKVRNRTTGKRGLGSWKAVHQIAIERDARAAYARCGRLDLPALRCYWRLSFCPPTRRGQGSPKSPGPIRRCPRLLDPNLRPRPAPLR